jgi:hypothetical protein
LKTAAGTLYDGDEPYVVISLDGAPRPNLEHFAPTVAAAGVLKQFFNMRNFARHRPTPFWPVYAWPTI